MSDSPHSAEIPRARITVLGSTGSIGQSALDIVRRHPDRFEVVALTAHRNTALLGEQIAEFRPQAVAVADPELARTLTLPHSSTRVLAGPDGLEEIASIPVDTVLCAMVGAAGLKPLLRAIDGGGRIALANKESLVMAGGLVLERVAARGACLIPVDSEHNAIFQCLIGHNRSDVNRIYLTASGGPFYGCPRQALASVTPEEAARHPRWSMGRKISVDSATLMNKGLEVIEAMWLFNTPLDRIEVLIHPQSVVHGLVEFRDGSILAHLGVTDMRLPILFALTWPERVESPAGRLDLAALGQCSFSAPDFSEFPCLRLALEAAKAGGTAPASLNAANEVAVEAFCQRRIGFTRIDAVVSHVLASAEHRSADSLETIFAADAAARRAAWAAVAQME